MCLLCACNNRTLCVCQNKTCYTELIVLYQKASRCTLLMSVTSLCSFLHSKLSQTPSWHLRLMHVASYSTAACEFSGHQGTHYPFLSAGLVHTHAQAVSVGLYPANLWCCDAVQILRHSVVRSEHFIFWQ